jgi:hypothetical protein
MAMDHPQISRCAARPWNFPLTAWPVFKRRMMLKNMRLTWFAFASSLFLFAAILFSLRRKRGGDALVAVWNRTDATAFLLAVLLMFIEGIYTWRIKIITAASGLSTMWYQSLFRFSSFLSSLRMVSYFCTIRSCESGYGQIAL